MDRSGNLYAELFSFKNLERAFRKARKGKGGTVAVQEFEYNVESELFSLKREIETFTYEPRSLRQFVIRDPKTRLISASHFRDRVVHHALCNILEPIFEKTFISDSYANRKGKGTHAALNRFHAFKRKVSDNGRLATRARDRNHVVGYALKADIRHYFDTVDHAILLRIIGKKVHDTGIMWLAEKILSHYQIVQGKGMPLGSRTSQFFANVYLNELDYFAKHKLKAKYYIRYVDDFVILDRSRRQLQNCKERVGDFLKTLALELHPEKSRILLLSEGVPLLGYRAFFHYTILKKGSQRRVKDRLRDMKEQLQRGEFSEKTYLDKINGWAAHARHADTFALRKRILADALPALGFHTADREAELI